MIRTPTLPATSGRIATALATVRAVRALAGLLSLSLLLGCSALQPVEIADETSRAPAQTGV
ncbi:hypothetical protein [Roseobacter ponti]|uniref:Lipoprotein n=1 Tax=Roseobacter ponti TaxID=1891787 RepID=A0A858SQN3_9RHOB|nr:hypothetical protein [Roseobacter ponti]QJF50317.1 hypothetical protein G3256_03620 [Roseobacter ponti]